MEDADETCDVDDVQICNSYSEVSDRITYFIKRKHEDSSDRNIRVFGDSVSSDESSRTSTAVTAKRLRESECFVKKSKVINPSGSQCGGGLGPVSENNSKLTNITNTGGPKSDIQERISNLEKCLKIEKYNHDNIDIYNKLKSIEDKVLKLENIIMNVDGNHSLSKILDQCTRNMNHNLNTDNINAQENLITKDKSKNEEEESTVPRVLPKTSKYSAEEIQKFINKINNKTF